MRKKRERQQQRRPMAWADAAARVIEEPEDEDTLDRLRFDCSQNAIRLDAQTDRLLAVIFLTLIVGGLTLLLTANLDLWVGASIFLALACFVIGLGQTVLHAQILGRLALHADAVAIEDESSAEEFERLQREAGNQAGSQKFSLVLGALLATGGIIAHFWPYAWRAAAIGLGLMALIKVIDGLRYLVLKIRG
ncbi:MAG TPA: hypothetical protein VFI31_12355 [Pirellulales bacterium]|nr:hypothetical protein [Pirellulales bacterium]